MDVLAAARKMLENEPVVGMDAFGSSVCGFCGIGYGFGHKPDCPVPTLPKIVAALEAARAYIVEMEGQGEHIDVLRRVQAYTRLSNALGESVPVA